jgi:hypothetical protein
VDPAFEEHDQWGAQNAEDNEAAENNEEIEEVAEPEA